MTKTKKSLSNAIENLNKKKHVISEEANKAKEVIQVQQNESFKKGLSILEEFNHSVNLLIAIFKKSNFDDLAMFVSHPGRVLVLNFFIGLLRGIGFVIGAGIVIIFMAYLISTTVSPDWSTAIRLLSK